jgi:MFS family permease
MSLPISPPGERSSDRRAGGRLYDSTFALCYIANTLLMTAISLLFRYADFVQYLGGSELELGLIVGGGMVGALAMRVFQGVGIDRFGPRLVWLGSILLFIVSMLGHLAVTNVHGPAVYALRILQMVAVAGAFGASITFVSLRADHTRMAEMVGVLGSSGFIGLALGPALGDWLFRGGEITRGLLDQMFVLSAVLGVLSLFCTALATHGVRHRVQRKAPPMWALIRRYHPGWLLVVSLAMGMGMQLPNIFLRPFAAELGISQIKIFFLVYAGAAFAIRMLTRRWSDQVGARPIALMGLTCLSLSMLLYLTVETKWGMSLPAVLAGIAHAFLFPAVVSGGGTAFPARYRGLATTLILSMFDLGALLGQPAVGLLVDFSRGQGWPPYHVMFVSVATLMAAVAVAYYLGSRNPAPVVRRRRRKPQNISAPTVHHQPPRVSDGTHVIPDQLVHNER